MSGTDDASKDRVVAAAVRLHKTLYPEPDETLAEWDDDQQAALNALIKAIEDHLDAKEAERATDS
jgi:hypothetical protein